MNNIVNQRFYALMTDLLFCQYDSKIVLPCSLKKAIVILSSFDVDLSGGDGSFNPNSTYDNWNWILVRNDWEQVDHGY